ncbi:MAG: aminoglycoside phosphotransferase family protein [Verrucomicrobiia bacterium]
MLIPRARHFLNGTVWHSALIEPLAGDASVRRYFRLRQDGQTAVLMDASPIPQTVVPFIQVDQHLRQLGFSAPEILAQDEASGFLVLEDFGDDTFARLLDGACEPEPLFTLATDVLVALHQRELAVPEEIPQDEASRNEPPNYGSDKGLRQSVRRRFLRSLRPYSPERMLADLELFLDGCTPELPKAGRAEFRSAWREVLPWAHQVPASLLLRDYHAANLMWLSKREGVRRAGLLDFQDAYYGPVTYDLMSLLEDARRDVSQEIRQRMIARYLAEFPALDRDRFHTSLAILAAVRHTRVLGIFERLSRCEQKHEYKQVHSPRVQGLLCSALEHHALAGVKHWMERYAS